MTIAPVAAVQHGAPGAYVYRIKPDNTVEVRAVKTGVTEGDRVQIVSGLDPGDTVVVDRADRLRDGAKIRVVPDPGNAGGRLVRDRRKMNPSRLFILRPVATTLLMAALLLVGHRRLSLPAGFGLA